jgi:hypothetical protein
MDAASYRALSLALDRETGVLEDTMLALERQRMLTEDLAGQALSGRAGHNNTLRRTDVNSWSHEYLLLVQAIDDLEERARLALQRVEALATPGNQHLAEEARALLAFDEPMDAEEMEEMDMRESDDESDDSP